MALLYDHREDKSDVPRLLQELDVPLEAAHLSEGDYLIGERICVERKSAPDFVASLKDRRLWDQITRITSSYEVAVLLVEGDPLFPQAPLEGAYAGIVRRGVALFQVEDSLETASFIRRLWEQENRPKSRRRPPATRKWRGDDEIAEDCLAAIPGISVTKAADLLEHFGNLQTVFSASADELQEVPGIGKKTALSLSELFSYRRKSRPWH